ncbi:hypothetical protein AMTRI_Chr04g247180 [Amborella trichopoda]|uniref:Uncharacterized protein n=1 Tax=Amborella trichopoda TaxID=13333 RepID=W1NDR0_AMBTC|nr:uncharacterized protein At4g26450 [Amborella trichopoda]ERM93852.1 hypothetical protein AMTR_s00138p00095470 [Amborella trichopoda]|eukprot:XP_006826615.1 uncharacterized protein At4g26450 [Amborella trichopoda]
MHARHRSPGSGARSNHMGIGLDNNNSSSMRGNHGAYNSEFRVSSRGGFGRGPPPKVYPPPRKSDIFMEAGRLAAEYLVYQGVLPANALTGGKWQNGSGKSDILEFRVQDRDNPDGRVSALTRLGNVMEPRSHLRGRRRIGGFRNFGWDRSRENGSGGRLEPCSDSNWDSNVEGEDRCRADKRGGSSDSGGIVVSKSEERSYDSDSDLENYEFPDANRASKESSEKDLSVTDANVIKEEEQSSYPIVTRGKDDVSETKPSIDRAEERESKSMPMLTGSSVNTHDGHELLSEDTTPTGKRLTPSREEGDAENNKQSIPLNHQAMEANLVSLCALEILPTHTLPLRSDAKPDQILSSVCDQEGRSTSGVGGFKEDFVDNSSSDSLTNLRSDGPTEVPEIRRVLSSSTVEDVGELDLALDLQSERFKRSHTFSDRSSFIHQQESRHGPPGFGGTEGERSPYALPRLPLYGRCRSVIQEGEKESFEHSIDTSVRTKRPRLWNSDGVSKEVEDYCEVNYSRAKETIPQAKVTLSLDEELIEAVEQEKFMDLNLIPEDELEDDKATLGSMISTSDIEYGDGIEQLMMNERNILEASEKAQTSDDMILDHHVSTHCSTLEAEQEASMCIGLLIRNICNGVQYKANGALCINDIDEPIKIDREDFPADDNGKGSLIEYEVFHTALQDLFDRFPVLLNLYQSKDITTELSCLVCLGLKRKIGIVYSGLGSLLNHAHEANDLPKIHRCYGRAICNLLGIHMPNFSKKANSSDLQNEIFCENVEGDPGDADPIYLSLEDIPISMPII